MKELGKIPIIPRLHKFVGSYDASNNKKYAFEMMAENWKQAEKHAQKLNIKIDGRAEKKEFNIPKYFLLSKKEFVKKRIEVLHQVCFLSDFALKSKIYKSEDILSDNGILHLLIHFFQGMDLNQDGTNFKELRKKYSTLFYKCLYASSERTLINQQKPKKNLDFQEV